MGLVTAIERVMEHVYMSALAHPSSDGDEDETRFPIVKNQLLPGLRSFCSALKGETLHNHCIKRDFFYLKEKLFSVTTHYTGYVYVVSSA